MPFPTLSIQQRLGSGDEHGFHLIENREPSWCSGSAGQPKPRKSCPFCSGFRDRLRMLYVEIGEVVGDEYTDPSAG